MKKEKYFKLKYSTLFLIMIVVSTVAEPQMLFRPRSDEIVIGPVAIQESIQGIPVALRAWSFISILPINNQLTLQARVFADLSDLQRKVGKIIDTIPLPTKNCHHDGLDNLIARIWGKELAIRGTTARLTLRGDVEVWSCVKNPVPCTRVDWDGIIPRTRVYDCNPPIKNRNLKQPFEATLPFSLTVPDAQSVAIALGQPTINLGGPLGSVSAGILKIAGVNLNDKVKRALEQAIKPDMLKKSLPPEVQPFQLRIVSASLAAADGGALTAIAEMKASISTVTATELIQTLIQQQR